MYLEKSITERRTLASGMQKHVKVAVLDLYNNEPNEGMRCIQQLLNEFALDPGQSLSWKVFDIRFKEEIPDLSYDIYISSGGPGSPLEQPGAQWEILYFNLIDAIIEHNETRADKKHLFFICHSFQLMCRHLGLADVTKRKSTAFGIFPVHCVNEGTDDVIFQNLPDPFYAVDSRDWQVVLPDQEKLKKYGATVLAIEKDRPHVPYERAVMAIRFSEYMIGTQFHPEADPVGMLHYMQREDKKQHIINHHGVEKYEDMLLHLNDPDKLLLTQKTILPNFLKHAIQSIGGNGKANDFS